MRDDSQTIAVTAFGMVTPLGLGYEASCAAIRAGLVRFAEVPSAGLMNEEGEPVGVVASSLSTLSGAARVSLPVAPEAALFVAPEAQARVSALAAMAFADLSRSERIAPTDHRPAPLFLALPSEERERGRDLAQEIPAHLERTSGLTGLGARTKGYPLGHAATIRALEEAFRALRTGVASSAFVGGVDSLVDLHTLRSFHDRGRLKTGDRPVGLIPGEGAAFLRIELVTRARDRGADILALLDTPATATEKVTIDSDAPCDGTALADAMTRALKDADVLRCGLLIGDLNGEPYRSEELGYAVTRVFRGVTTSFRSWHAADCIGDTGAASAAIAMGIAVRALRDGYARSDEVLVYASSDAGLRGAITLRANEKE